MKYYTRKNVMKLYCVNYCTVYTESVAFACSVESLPSKPAAQVRLPAGPKF